MLIASAALAAIIGIALAFSAFSALGGARLFGFAVRAILSVLLIVGAAGLTAIALGTQGMQALTNEQSAARIKVVPTGVQRYDATVTFADGRVETYDLAGDDIYVDAHIVKWTALANMLGLQTSYRLDRISGRYRTIEQESMARRTVYSIGTPVLVDLVALGKRLPLGDFFDAEYGSATYVPVAVPAELELMVSTTGLLLRPVAPPPATPRP
jgi:hypothetical protein